MIIICHKIQRRVELSASLLKVIQTDVYGFLVSDDFAIFSFACLVLESIRKKIGTYLDFRENTMRAGHNYERIAGSCHGAVAWTEANAHLWIRSCIK